MKPVIYNPLMDPDIYDPDMARFIIRTEEDIADPENNINLDNQKDLYPENNYPDYFRKAFTVASQKSKKLDETISMVFMRLAFDVDPQMDIADATIALAKTRQSYDRCWKDNDAVGAEEFKETYPWALKSYVETYPDVDYRVLGSAIRFATVLQYCSVNTKQHIEKTVHNLLEDAEIYTREQKEGVLDILSRTWDEFGKFSKVIRKVNLDDGPPNVTDVSMRNQPFTIRLPS